jgi:hypothetical protein
MVVVTAFSEFGESCTLDEWCQVLVFHESFGLFSFILYECDFGLYGVYCIFCFSIALQ